jgi:hypothetical protein
MKQFKKIIDEREELELLRIEHVWFWLLFWGLFISILVQSLFMNASFAQFGPEWILFMLGCFGLGFSCLKRGLWDYYTTPSLKTYFFASSIAAVVVGLIFGIAKYKTYEVFRHDIFGMLLPSVLIYSGSIFVLCFGAMFAVGQLTLRKRRKLEEQYQDGQDE